MKKNEITIISPVYNVEKYIKNFIISIKRQTFKSFELILVDDGSKDRSIELAEEELKRSDIHYKIISKKNGGQSSARNMGINACETEWLCLLDSDDTIHPNYLKVMYDNVKKYNCDLVFCELNKVTDKTIFNNSDYDNGIQIDKGTSFMKDFILHKIETGPYSFLIKKKILNDNSLLFNEKSRYSEEFTFIAHLFHFSNKVIYVKRKLYNYCLRGGSVSTGANIDKIINGYNEIIKNDKMFYNCNCDACIAYRKYAMPRWIIATARFQSKNMSYSTYKELMNKLNYKNEVPKLFDFYDKNIRLASRIIDKNLFFCYYVFRIWR